MPLDAEFLKLSDRFLDFIRAETGFHVIVCDESGTIVRATVRERIGSTHAFAKKVLQGECDEYAVTAEEAASNPLVKEGLNCPIVLGGRRVATFGIAGRLEVTRPVAHIAARVLSGWLKELHQTQALHATARQVFTGIDELSLRLEAGASTAQASADTTARAVEEAVGKLEQAEVTLTAVHGIAQQARILSINGSIEATRAGDHGRAFGVVAKDMIRLAEETKESSSAIQQTLAELGKAVKELQSAVQRSHEAADEQRRSVDAVNATVGALKQAVEGLEQGFDEAADAVTARPGARGTAPRAQAPRAAALPAPRAAPRP